MNDKNTIISLLFTRHYAGRRLRRSSLQLLTALHTLASLTTHSGDAYPYLMCAAPGDFPDTCLPYTHHTILCNEFQGYVRDVSIHIG